MKNRKMRLFKELGLNAKLLKKIENKEVIF